MEQLLNNLLLLLGDEVNLYQSLLKTLDNERKAIIAFDLRGINTACKIKENVILKIKILEEQRLHLINRLAEILKQSPAELTISRLAEKVDIRYSHNLSQYGAELLSIVQKIKEMNSKNRSLLSHSQQLVSGSLSLLETILTPDPVYYRDGSLASRDRQGQMLTSTG